MKDKEQSALGGFALEKLKVGRLYTKPGWLPGVLKKTLSPSKPTVPLVQRNPCASV